MINAAIKILHRKYMNVTMRSGPDYMVRIVERPGLWMKDAALAGLTADLRMIAGRTLDTGTLTYGVFAGDKSGLSDVIITLVMRRDGTPVAFNALAVMQVDMGPQVIDVLHLGLVMVDPEERSKNLSWVLYGLTCFLIFFRRQFRPVWISNVTQVPAVVGMVSEMFSNVWPNPRHGRRTLNHLLLARRIMGEHRHVFGVGQEAEFDDDRFVITNAYTGGSDDLKKTWDAAPKHRNPQYNDYCATALNYDRGDDVIQLGQMDLAAMRSYLAREVPKSAVVGLILAGGLIAFRRLILPALHWADSGRHWSVLRPYEAKKK